MQAIESTWRSPPLRWKAHVPRFTTYFQCFLMILRWRKWGCTPTYVTSWAPWFAPNAKNLWWQLHKSLQTTTATTATTTTTASSFSSCGRELKTTATCAGIISVFCPFQGTRWSTSHGKVKYLPKQWSASRGRPPQRVCSQNPQKSYIE